MIKLFLPIIKLTYTFDKRDIKYASQKQLNAAISPKFYEHWGCHYFLFRHHDSILIANFDPRGVSRWCNYPCFLSNHYQTFTRIFLLTLTSDVACVSFLLSWHKYLSLFPFFLPLIAIYTGKKSKVATSIFRVSKTLEFCVCLLLFWKQWMH